MSRDVPVAGDRLPDSIRMLAPGAVTGMIDSTAVVDSILSQADSVPVRKSRIRRDKVDLDAQVVCEGVETEGDTELMMEIGAYVAQGYRYCKPVPEDVFEEMIV